MYVWKRVMGEGMGVGGGGLGGRGELALHVLTTARDPHSKVTA